MLQFVLLDLPNGILLLLSDQSFVSISPIRSRYPINSLLPDSFLLTICDEKCKLWSFVLFYFPRSLSLVVYHKPKHIPQDFVYNPRQIYTYLFLSVTHLKRCIKLWLD
jgi:hypothetical protein